MRFSRGDNGAKLDPAAAPRGEERPDQPVVFRPAPLPAVPGVGNQRETLERLRRRAGGEDGALIVFAEIVVIAGGEPDQQIVTLGDGGGDVHLLEHAFEPAVNEHVRGELHPPIARPEFVRRIQRVSERRLRQNAADAMILPRPAQRDRRPHAVAVAEVRLFEVIRLRPIDDGLEVPDLVIPQRRQAQAVRRLPVLAEIKAHDVEALLLRHPLIPAKVPHAPAKAVAHEHGAARFALCAPERAGDGRLRNIFGGDAELLFAPGRRRRMRDHCGKKQHGRK